jgi:hypothetical protein
MEVIDQFAEIRKTGYSRLVLFAEFTLGRYLHAFSKATKRNRTGSGALRKLHKPTSSGPVRWFVYPLEQQEGCCHVERKLHRPIVDRIRKHRAIFWFTQGFEEFRHSIEKNPIAILKRNIGRSECRNQVKDLLVTPNHLTVSNEFKGEYVRPLAVQKIGSHGT